MTRLQILLVAVLLAMTAGGGYWFGRGERAGHATTAAGAKPARKVLFYRNPMNPSVTSPVPAKDDMGMDYVPVYADDALASAAPRKALFYRNPMNPSVTSPVPAKDEMGMDYVPVYADDAPASAPGTVSIDPTIVQDMGVRTAMAERRVLARNIRAVGRIDYDEKGLVHVNLRSDGWVQRLIVTDTGQPVRRGQALLTLYSPQIVSSEQEYLLALRGVAALGADAPPTIAEQARALRDSSAERLRLLGVPAGELRRLERGGKVRQQITLVAPASGIVQFVGAREGQFVTMRTEVYRIADLSSVWLLADLYEDEIPWVRVGDHAEVQLRGLPGKPLQAQVDYVYPYLEGRTRTQRVRLNLPNPGGLLKPDMYADVTFSDAHAVEAVTVPQSAVVRTGTRAQVFVERAPGRFEPRPVRLGVAADGNVQILDGLEGGEKVVVSGEFLIDSESKLREAAQKMLSPGREQESGPKARPMAMDVAEERHVPAAAPGNASPQNPAARQDDGSRKP